MKIVFIQFQELSPQWILTCEGYFFVVILEKIVVQGIGSCAYYENDECN